MRRSLSFKSMNLCTGTQFFFFFSCVALELELQFSFLPKSLGISEKDGSGVNPRRIFLGLRKAANTQNSPF